jgi:hypothetical protein
VNVLLAIRPDSWNLPLLVHVVGAMVLVGGLFAGAGALAFGRRDPSLLLLGYRSLLAVALPGWILMRAGAQWIYVEQGWDDLPDTVDEPRWLAIGGAIADVGGAVFLVTLVVGAVGVRRLRAGRGTGLLGVTLALSVLLLAAYLVAAWAMAGKPD